MLRIETKCDVCAHKHVCVYADQTIKQLKELQAGAIGENLNTLSNVIFHATCKHFQKAIVNLRFGEDNTVLM